MKVEYNIYKFRAYDYGNKKMIHIPDLIWFAEKGIIEINTDGSVVSEGYDKYIITQAKPYYDENKKNVYVGDIVKFVYTGMSLTARPIPSLHIVKVNERLNEFYPHCSVVVGNIFEDNLDVLKVEHGIKDKRFSEKNIYR